MQRPLIIIGASFLFALIGVLAAWGTAACAPSQPFQRPDFERTMFILAPIVGAIVGWLGGYLTIGLTSER